MTVNAAWDFKEGTSASKNSTILGYGSTATKPTEAITITSDSGSGAKLVLIIQNNCAVKYNKGLQWGTGSKETDVMTITADADCTVSVAGKGASSGDTSKNSYWSKAGKPNSFSVNGTSVYARKADNETSEQTWTVNLKKGENTIAVSGMLFTSFTCK